MASSPAGRPPLDQLADDDLDARKFELDAAVVAARSAMASIQEEQDRRAGALVKRRQREGGQKLGPAAIASEESVTMESAGG